MKDKLPGQINVFEIMELDIKKEFIDMAIAKAQNELASVGLNYKIKEIWFRNVVAVAITELMPDAVGLPEKRGLNYGNWCFWRLKNAWQFGRKFDLVGTKYHGLID